MTDWRVTCGDTRELDLPDGSVQVICTSVPYWGLRKYIDNENEIGREPTLQEWLDNLVACAQEWRRCLHPSGVLFVNCGDSYNSQGGHTQIEADGRGNRAARSQMKGANVKNLKPKDLMMLPARLALALRADGWYLRSSICWVKGLDWLGAERQAQDDIRDALALVREQAAGSLWGLSNGLDKALRKAGKAVDRLVMSGAVMPESVSDRPTSAYEMVFLFSKSKRYFYDGDAVRVSPASSTMARWNNNPYNSIQNEGYIPWGTSEHNPGRHIGEQNMGVNPAGRNARNVWRIPVRGAPAGGYQLPDGRVVSHFAAYPVALAARCIAAGTSEAGRCEKCSAPFIRVTKPTPEYAKLLGNDWADHEQDATEGRGHSISQRPTKRGKKATASYETVAWIPSCNCFGEPVPAGVMCGKCGGTGRETVWLTAEERNDMGRGDGRAYTCDWDKKGKTETGRACPACLCPDCGGTGRETRWEAGERARQTEIPSSSSGHSNYPHGNFRKDGNPSAASPIETGNPCPTCDGNGATGVVNGEVWLDDVLANWPRKPCVVLDPMAGSGQTGRAALGLGRTVILNDLNPEYCDLAQARLEAWPDDLGGPKKEKADDLLPLLELIR